MFFSSQCQGMFGDFVTGSCKWRTLCESKRWPCLFDWKGSASGYSMLFLCWPTKDTKHVVHSFMTCHVVFVSSSTLVTLHDVRREEWYIAGHHYLAFAVIPLRDLLNNINPSTSSTCRLHQDYMEFQFPRPFCHLRDVSLPGGLVEVNEIEVLAKHKIVQIERRKLVVTVQSIETYDQLTPAFFFADIFSWTTLLCLFV